MAKTPLVKNVNTNAQNHVIQLIPGTPFCSSTSSPRIGLGAVLGIAEIGGIGAEIHIGSHTNFIHRPVCTHRRDAVSTRVAGRQVHANRNGLEERASGAHIHTSGLRCVPRTRVPVCGRSNPTSQGLRMKNACEDLAHVLVVPCGYFSSSAQAVP